MKQKQARYEMHKYWGKKPSPHLSDLIQKYSSPGDVVLDPFSGYGVFACEALLSKRHVISHDLNPVAHFIQKQLFALQTNIKDIRSEAESIIQSLKQEHDFWYTTHCNKCGGLATVVSTLRTKDNSPIKNKVTCACTRSAFEQQFTPYECKALLEKENGALIPDHPVSKLMRNGRISAFDGMTTDDLFTKRSLYFHARLFKGIQNVKNEKIRDLLLLAFTSNIANCSRLVPPIKSRGEMAPGAWMTGFYIGETYLENNVIHYFENRVHKICEGKKDYYSSIAHEPISLSKLSEFEKLGGEQYGFILDQGDAKKLKYPDDSVDFIFTDPPYGDTVPYFEQSIIWNTWLFENRVDYENELVISDSKERQKRISSYTFEMNKCIAEIHRVLKTGKFFSITFHSLAGDEWYALTNACLKAGFSFHDAEWLSQKTFAPRQLNRNKTVKGDLLITFQKVNNATSTHLRKKEAEGLIKELCSEFLSKRPANTNDLYIYVLKHLFNSRIVFDEINIIEVLNTHFSFCDGDLWSIAA